MGRILIYRSNCPTVCHIFLPRNDRLVAQIRSGIAGNTPAISYQLSAMTQLLSVVPTGEPVGAIASDKPGLGHYGCKRTQGTKLNNLEWHYNLGNPTIIQPHTLLQLWAKMISNSDTLPYICL